MVADKGKKSKLEEKGMKENAEQIDAALVFSIEKLQEIQEELYKVNVEASEKIFEVEQKYNKIRKPVYDKRSDIIKSIPDFWLTAFLSHPVLGELLTEGDQKIFMHISSIEVGDFEQLKSSYSISFNFNSNPYFEDTKLTKTFTFLDDEVKITATQIKWKEGMGLPNGANHEKKGNKRKFAEESFFTWFSDAQRKVDEDEIHDEVAEIIREELWPNPLTFFNNEADEEDSDGYGDEEGEDDDNDDEDDQDDDDDNN
ncbi:hypothetical protein GQ457_04G036580 [Hibiscus cannabinus]